MNHDNDTQWKAMNDWRGVPVLIGKIGWTWYVRHPGQHLRCLVQRESRGESRLYYVF